MRETHTTNINKLVSSVSQGLDPTPSNSSNASGLLKLLTCGAPGHRFPLIAHDRQQLQLWVSGLGGTTTKTASNPCNKQGRVKHTYYLKIGKL